MPKYDSVLTQTKEDYKPIFLIKDLKKTEESS